jgi:HD-GYP domain-containing protein (c-di-GMP phosphodiesterase class II)
MQWAAETAVIFAITYIISAILYKRQRDDLLHHNTKEVGKTIFIVFISGGIMAGIFNALHHNFPPESGMKLAVGWLTIGFFITMDMSLNYRHSVIQYLADTKQHLEISESYASLSKKFLIFSSLAVLFVIGATYLVVIKDIEWILTTTASHKAASISVLKEFAFIFAVFIGYSISVSASFTTNLRLYLKHQNETLSEVINGNLDVCVPVSSLDEFGHMAMYTNAMIESLKDRTEALQLTQDVSILSLASLAETRDNETGAHIMRTQRYVRVLAEALKEKEGYKQILTDENIDLIYKSAPLHDVGKVGIPDSILLKPGKLTDEEFKIMKRHPYYGKKSLATASGVLGNNSFLKFAEEISYAHHEKWDGTGYPQKLKRDEIPVSGRIMALADVYDALISKRVYKDAFSHEKAKGIILESAGTHFDPAVVDAFINCEEKFLEIAEQYSDSNYKAAANSDKELI